MGFETGAEGEIFSVAFVGTLVVIARANSKLVVVNILATKAPCHLLQFLFQAAGCIAKALKDAVDARHIVVVALQALVEIGGKFVVALDGACGNEQFVGIHGHRKAVVFVDGHHQSAAQTQVGGDEFAVVIAAEINLTADVRDVHAQA